MKRLPLLLLLSLSIAATISTAEESLRVSDNQRFLVTESGEPFFWLADTAWELFHRLNLEEGQEYLRNRAGKEFTVIQTVLLAECDGLTDPTPEGFLPLHDADPTRPNEDYFKKVDALVDYAADQGLYFALLPTWGAHAQDKRHPFFDNLNIFTSESAYAYGKYLGNRYKDRWNVIWVLGGDRGPDETAPIWDSMAKGITDGAGGDRLLSYHINGPNSTTDHFLETPWLDFHMRQTGHYAQDIPMWDLMLFDYNTRPTRPVLNAEPCYEDIPIGFNTANEVFTDYDCRKAAYWSVFAGGFGHTYGHSSVWQMYDEGRFPVLGPSQPWRQSLEAPGALQMRHLRRLIESRPFLSRIPDQSILLDGQSYASRHIQVTRDGPPGNKDATYIMAYLPIVAGFEIDTSVISGEQLRCWWYDPRNGAAYNLGTFENGGSFKSVWRLRIRDTMRGPDWIFVIDDASKKYPRPGAARIN